MVNNPLIYLLGSTGCLLIALHSKQTNLGAIASSFGGMVLAQTSMSKAFERFPEDEIKSSDLLIRIILRTYAKTLYIAHNNFDELH